MNDDQLQAQDVSASQALQLARTVPMMSQKRLIMVRYVEQWEGKADSKRAATDFDALASYAETPMDSSVLVLAGATLNARRRLVQVAKKQGFLVACDALPANELAKWIGAAAVQRGSRISPACAELLAELAGPELSQISDALERLSLYAAPAGEIDEAAIGACISTVKTRTVWELLGALGRRDTGAVLEAVHDVYDPSDRGLRLLGVLAWSTRQLLRFRAALDDGLPAADAATQAGAPPFKARELQRQVKQLPAARLEEWLCVLAKVDLALKGGSKRPPVAILEEALIRLCSGY